MTKLNKPTDSKSECGLQERAPIDLGRRKMIIGIGALLGLSAVGALNQACGRNYISGSAAKGGDADGGDALGSKGHGDLDSKGKGDHGLPGDPEGSLAGDFDSKGNGDYDNTPGDPGTPGGDADLSGQACVPEGSRWSPDGQCLCAPEGCCNTPGNSCKPPCAKDINNVCQPPNLWHCF